MAQLCGFEEEVVQGNGKERESGATEAERPCRHHQVRSIKLGFRVGFTLLYQRRYQWAVLDLYDGLEIQIEPKLFGRFGFVSDVWA